MKSLTPSRNYLGLKLTPGAALALYRIATNLGKIEAIAMVRWKTGMGLIDSKTWVEKFLSKYEKEQNQ